MTCIVTVNSHSSRAVQYSRQTNRYPLNINAFSRFDYASYAPWLTSSLSTETTGVCIADSYLGVIVLIIEQLVIHRSLLVQDVLLGII